MTDRSHSKNIGLSPVIFKVLETLPVPGHYWLAYSGGMDSTALLSLLAAHRDRLPAELVAVYVNHQLSANADLWEKHCRDFCRKIAIRFESVSINVRDGRNDSPEAWARELRYAALEKFMQKDDVLLTAHHCDDLAETVIQQMLRGSGPEGLSAIPETRRFGQGWLARPMLAYTRKQIEEYVKDQQLAWVEDESNSDQGIDRNFIRNTVMPTLRKRWPSVANVLWRVSRVQADATSILVEIANQDLHGTVDVSGTMLNLSAMDKLSLPRQKNLLRFWIRDNNYKVPGMNVIDEIMTGILHARPDSMPCIKWGDTEIRRYRDHMYIMSASHGAPYAQSRYPWSLEKPLQFDGGRLEAILTQGRGIRAERVPDKKVEIHFREGGESIRPAGRKETHELKKLFQDSAVPPWKRDKIPLVYVGDELAAVVGHWIADGFKTTANKQGWEIVFTEKD